MSKITRALEELAKRSSEGKVVPDKVSDAIDLLTERAVNGDAVAEAELLRFDPRFDPRKLEKDRLGALKVDFNQTRPDPPPTCCLSVRRGLGGRAQLEPQSQRLLYVCCM